MHRRIGQGFAHGTLAELAPKEKNDFIRRWCEVTIPDPTRREDEAEKLRRGIHGSDRIERLTTNPMLLTTMALVQRKVGKLPTRRHKLYWEAVGVLLNWRPEVDEVMDPDEALPQLEYLAYAMCDRGVQRLRRDEVLELFEDVRHDYPNIRLLQHQTPEAFLAQLERRTGLLVEAGEVQQQGRPIAVYEFRHLTFQEYLAALAILDGRFPGHRQGTTLAERVKPLAGRVATVDTSSGPELQVTENWREALRLCVASCNDDDVDPVLTAIVEARAPEEARPRAILAVLCLADEPNVSEARAKDILRRFAEQVGQNDARGPTIGSGADVAAMEAADSVWVELLRQALVTEFLRRASLTRSSPGFLSGIVANFAIPTDKAERVEWMAKQAHALRSQSDLEATGASLIIAQAAYTEQPLIVMELVKNLLPLLGRGPAVAHAAAWALGWLSEHGSRGKPYWVPSPEERRSLLQYMAASNPDPEALRWLLMIARTVRMREAAPACIAALGHTSERIRSTAAKALSRVGDISAVEPLRSNLRDPDRQVRCTALGALVKLEVVDKTDINLLSDGRAQDLFFDSSIDPQQPISINRARNAARTLKLPEKEVRARYEKLAARYNLSLEWHTGS